MKKALSLILALAMVFALAACGKKDEAPSTPDASGDGSYPKLQLSISTSGGDTGIDTIAANHFADLISEKTGGQITARVYPQAQLTGGDQSKVAEMLAAGGSFEFGICSGANLSSLSNAFQTHQLPFLYTSYAEAEAAKQKFIDAGATIIELTDEQHQAFVDAVNDVKMSFVDKYGEDICRAFGVID